MLHAYIATVVLCLLSRVIAWEQFCENPANESPLLADCYAALALVPTSDTLVLVPQSTEPHVAAKFVSGTCFIKVSDFTPPGMKAVTPGWQIKWYQINAAISQAISMCATTDANVITGAVVWYALIEVRIVKVGSGFA